MVRRARDEWIEMTGTRSGSWLMATETEAERSFADPLPVPPGEEVFQLGAVHRRCLRQAYVRLRAQQVVLPDSLPVVFVDEPPANESFPRLHLPPRRGECPFCSRNYVSMSEEDIYPLWLIRELQSRGAGTIRDGRWVARISLPTIPVCIDCNNTWMSTMEQDVKPQLISLFDNVTLVDRFNQVRLATWATKIALLLDAAGPNPLIPRGFGHDLRIRKQPHRGIWVWMATYSDVADVLPVHPWLILPPAGGDSDEVHAVCITFSVFRVAFQVLIPLVGGGPAELETFGNSVVQIWPPGPDDIDWPLPYFFDRESIVAFSRRIYDNRESVPLHVALTASVRQAPQ
ncbi:hypothetical protein [Dactylosporangium salmoneum]|uniref:hypothetical protein n=1 Tax=Dactylosporangium salmoneum TaxID=53361 RepID=UPI0031D7F019